MSRYDYEQSKLVHAGMHPFYSLIMAAMRKADTANLDLLTTAFPFVWKELSDRYDAPGGILPGDSDPDPRIDVTINVQ